jgi:tape measure domain-containing protein
VAYRADIEIAVRGAQELKRLQNEVSATSKLVNTLNNYLENIGSGGVVRNINNLRDIVSQAANAFNNAALNTEEATTAATKYVRATQELNSGLRERALLLKQVTEQERKARLAAAGIRETTQYSGPIGPGAASAVGTLAGQKSPVAERVQRIIQSKKDEAELQAALLRLEEKSASVLNQKVQSQQNLVKGTQEVYELLVRQQQKASFLAGKSGALMQGPLAAAGAMGFPVALPMTAAEQEGLRAAAQKQQILQRMAATRQQLVGLAANLQRLDQNSAIAIADAKRAQESLNLARERELQIAKEVAAIRSKEGAASVAARQRLAGEAARRQLIQNAGFGVQGPALPPAAGGTARRGQGIGGRVGGAISGSIIGGAFPLLFGQGGGAAAGGAIGGLLGGLAGPGGSFAGSLLGTLLGDIASRGQAVKQLAEDIGFSAQQTKQLSDAFKVANTDVEKFTAVIQNIRGVGLEIEDQAKAIQLVTRLTELYGGSFEKTGNAITSALESGKVSQATLNQLTSQGINVQQALADKYKVSRSTILEMAKDGDISVQTLIDTLVELGNNSEQVATKQQNVFQQAYDQIAQAAAQAAQTASGSFTSTGNELQETAARIQAAFTSMFNELIRGTTEFILGLGEIARIAGTALDSVAGKFTEIQYGIIGAAQNLPVLDSGIIEFAKNALAVLNPVGALIDKIRGAGRNKPQQFGPPVPERLTRAPLAGFNAPSQLAGGGAAGAKGPKPPEDRTAQLQADYKALLEIGNAENLIRDFLFEGRELLAVDVELTKTLADIERDRVKALEQANYQSERELINKTAIARESFARQVIEDKIREITQKRFEEELRAQQAIRDAVKPFTDLTKQQQLQAQYGRTYLRLVTEGVLPAEAERIANFERLVTEQLTAVEEQIKITELAILEAKARGTSTVELEKQLKIFKDQQNAVQSAAAAGPEKGKTGTERLQDAIATARGELNNLTDPINQVVAGAKAIGDAFQQAFKGLVSGAMTGQQALAAFFKGVGDHFMDMASQMIAKLIEIYILQTVLGLISGAASGNFQSKSNAAGKATFGGSFKGTGSSTFGSGGIRVPGFAEGGFVTGPTRAVIGEGGEPEYVIPQSKMSAAMSRYSRGARGKSVIPGSGTSADGNTATAALEPIDVRYSVERINNVEYVTVGQFQAGMSQAAQQGAQRGEQATLRRLQQSSSTRRRIGM